MDRSCIRAWSGKPGAPAYLDELPADAAAVLVEYRAAVAAQLDERLISARGLIGTFGLVALEPLTADPMTRELWFGLRSAMYPLVAATRPPGTSVVIEDVAVPPDGLAELILGLRSLFARYGYSDTGFIFGHLAAGNVHFVTLNDLGSPGGVERFGLFVEDLAGLVLGLDGSLKAEHGTGRAMAPFLAREWGNEAVAVMREVKGLIDPDGMLNPGVLLNDDPRAHLAHVKHTPIIGDDAVDRCVECGFCERLCPSRELTLTPRQRIVGNRIALEFREAGEANRAGAIWGEYAYDGTDTCVGDGLCATVCPAGINVAYLTDHQRAEMHGAPLEGLMDLAARRFAVVEELLRRGIDLGRAIDDRRDGEGMSWVTAAARRLVPDLPQWSRSITKAPPRVHCESADPHLVYFPACVSRIMGSSALGKDSLMATVLRVAERAGLSVRLPPGAAGLCCGQIWEHKGFSAGQATMANRLVAALWQWSEGGRLPIMCDVTSCARTMLVELEREQFGAREQLLSEANRERHAQLRIMDLAEWLHDDVLGRLEIKRKKKSVLVHPTCACTQLGLDKKIAAIVAACAEDVTIPYSLGCCGAGGDRGFLYPELADAAMHDEAEEIKGRSYDGAYSFAKTCEIVLADRTGRPFESLIYLVDEVTA
jgi:D-lactate dehydrogenase